jgi:hypothetical protein
MVERMLKAVICIIMACILAGCGKVEQVPGPQGPAGPQGPVGTAGNDGVGCTQQIILPGDAVLPYGGALITCANGAVLISNGAPGQNGKDGVPVQTAYAIMGIVNPCGNQSSQDEIFLRLADGSLIASFSDDKNGKNTRLSEIFDGVGYTTTDGTNCVFSVGTSNGIRTISWSGGSQSWALN